MPSLWTEEQRERAQTYVRTLLSPQGLLLQREANCVHIIVASPLQTSFNVPPIINCPCPSPSLWALLQFRVGSHALPVEQGRFARPPIPRNLRRCTLCSTQSIGDERNFLFECPHFDEIRAQHADLFDSSANAMRSFVWQKDQQAVCDCMAAVIRWAET